MRISPSNDTQEEGKDKISPLNDLSPSNISPSNENPTANPGSVRRGNVVAPMQQILTGPTQAAGTRVVRLGIAEVVSASQ